MWTIFITKQIPEKLKSYFNGAILRFVIRTSETAWAQAELIVSQGSYKEFTQDMSLWNQKNQKALPRTQTYHPPHKARHHPAAVCDRRRSARRVLLFRWGWRVEGGWLCGAAVCVSRTVVTDAATRIKAKESNAAAALFHHFCLHKYLFSLMSAKNNPVTPNCCFSNARTHTLSVTQVKMEYFWAFLLVAKSTRKTKVVKTTSGFMRK